jgi:hypothetical protein
MLVSSVVPFLTMTTVPIPQLAGVHFQMTVHKPPHLACLLDAVGELLKEMRPILLLLRGRGDSLEDLSQANRYIYIVPGKMTQLLLTKKWHCLFDKSNKKTSVFIILNPSCNLYCSHTVSI